MAWCTCFFITGNDWVPVHHVRQHLSQTCPEHELDSFFLDLEVYCEFNGCTLYMFLFFCGAGVRELWQMSGALHGYVDSSSTDKGAADKTDEVYLEVLCLTGEGVTLSVPRSILGYDLSRLVSEKLPWKPGAKLAMHHVNRKLNLDQTLREQGIVEKSAVLSFALICQQICIQHGVMSLSSQLVREFALEVI